MKRIITTVFLIIATVTLSFGQGKISRIWSNPAAFRADEQVTFYFDVSGTQLEGEPGPLYLWTWGPGDPAAGNGDWTNSGEHMKLTHVSGNVWSFTMKPTEFYNKGVADVKQIFGLLKLKDGSKKTDDFKEENENAIVLYDFSTMANKIIDVQPANYKGNEPVSIILNVANAWSEGGSSQGQLVGKQPAMHSGINGWQKVVASDDASGKQKLKSIGDNLFRLDIIPHEYYGTTDVITEINAVFNDNGAWTASARDAGGVDFKLTPKLPGPEPEKEYKWFPGKFTVEDVVTFYFNQNVTKNEDLKSEPSIYYSIKANGQTVEGKAKSIGNGRFRVSLIIERIFADADDISSFELTFKNAQGTATSEKVVIDSKNLVQLD